MGSVMKRMVLATLLLSLLAAHGQAQDVLQARDWPTHFRDSANTVNTPAPLSDTLNVLWEEEGMGGQSPRVYIVGGRQLVISGNYVYDAASGAPLWEFPNAGLLAAITTADGIPVFLTGRPRDSFLDTGHEFFAYNLLNFELLWSLDSTVKLTTNRYMELNAKDGVFYITGAGACDSVAAVDAKTGAVIWEALDCDLPIQGDSPFGSIEGCAVASVNFGDTEKDVVFVAIYGGGVVALATDDNGDWYCVWYVANDNISNALPCVDEAAGIVYVSNQYDFCLHAYDAANGTPIQGWPRPLDHILNGSPTLGWAQNSALEGLPVPAVFAVTGGAYKDATVYAYSRPGGNLLWVTSIPSTAYSSAVYSGDSSIGKLYIAANNGFTYVLDAFTGAALQILATDFYRAPRARCPAIVDVDFNGTDEGVMYFVNNGGQVAAWSTGVANGVPEVFHLSLSPATNEIDINSFTEVTAKLVNGNIEGRPGQLVTFSCDAEKNQGYMDPITISTDADGLAKTWFYSQNRTGIVTVRATADGANSVRKYVFVIKGGGEEPSPVTTGSIQGTVFYNDKPARKLVVSLDGITLEVGENVATTTTTNPRGKYSFDSVYPGAYWVSATKDGVTATSTLVTMPSPPDVISGVDLYLVTP